MLSWIGKNHPKLSLFLTIPHSGEALPEEAGWLHSIAEPVLLTDVDRFVDRLVAPAAEALPLPALVAHAHRYAVDLNRFPQDVDQDSVMGAPDVPGSHPKGFHWVKTTQGELLMSRPISRSSHELLVRKYHDAFHSEVEGKGRELRALFPGEPIFHLDCHSMPSVGTGAHADQGQTRPDVVISDCEGKSADPAFSQRVIAAFEREGLRVCHNWPYKGGRITQRYGRPEHAHHTVQIELNRALYMDERTRQPHEGFEPLCQTLLRVFKWITQDLHAGSPRKVSRLNRG